MVLSPTTNSYQAVVVGENTNNGKRLMPGTGAEPLCTHFKFSGTA
jgi:hypothetical protein